MQHIVTMDFVVKVKDFSFTQAAYFTVLHSRIICFSHPTLLFHCHSSSVKSLTNSLLHEDVTRFHYVGFHVSSHLKQIKFAPCHVNKLPAASLSACKQSDSRAGASTLSSRS